MSRAFWSQRRLSSVTSCENPLHQAVLDGDLVKVKDLLKLSDTDVNAALPTQDMGSGWTTYSKLKGITALHLAALKGSEELVKALMSAGACVDIEFEYETGGREESGPRAGQEYSEITKYTVQDVAQDAVKQVLQSKEIVAGTVQGIDDSCLHLSFAGLDGSIVEVELKASDPLWFLIDAIGEKVGSRSFVFTLGGKILDLRSEIKISDAFGTAI